MNPRTGSDGKPDETRFELRLPKDWNGRFLYQGGGGNDGVVNPAVGRQATPGHALNRGFAVVSTGAGHQGATPEFGLDATARVDHAYAAHDRAAAAAKGLLERHYLKPADKSDFVGCSDGGRQARMFSQRCPGYFGGILAIAPAMTVEGRLNRCGLGHPDLQRHRARTQRHQAAGRIAARGRPGLAARAHPCHLRCAGRAGRWPAVQTRLQLRPRGAALQRRQDQQLPERRAGRRVEEELRRPAQRRPPTRTSASSRRTTPSTTTSACRRPTARRRTWRACS